MPVLSSSNVRRVRRRCTRLFAFLYRRLSHCPRLCLALIVGCALFLLYLVFLTLQNALGSHFNPRKLMVFDFSNPKSFVNDTLDKKAFILSDSWRSVNSPDSSHGSSDLEYSTAGLQPLYKTQLRNDNANSSSTFSKADPAHLHGVYALDDHLEPLWKPVPLKFRMSYQDKVLAHTGYCFNTRVCESLPLDRPVPDYNSKKCHAVTYAANLPAASVIIVFHNENLAVLLRSVHSVLDRTPPHLLKEIILVDDYSNRTTHPWLFEPLDYYVARVPKTHLTHLQDRHGLMRARIVGANLATSQILVFLDSHIETTPRWIEPLLETIQANRTNVVVPLINTIDYDHFRFENHVVSVLSFSWTLGQKHLKPASVEFEPLKSPIMAGGLFAIDKQWFADLGQYDRELRLYGGEELEIGFKTWMCGGQLLVLPCSRVGHVFRNGKYWSKQVYAVPATEIFRNKLRVAEVWMDEFAVIARASIGQLPESTPLGSIEEARSVRERLQCRSFKWFLDNIATDVPVPELGPGSRLGAIRQVQTNACLDTLQQASSGNPLGAYPCHKQGGSQAFLLEADGTLRPIENNLSLCISGKSLFSRSVKMTTNCESAKWTYNTTTLQIALLASLRSSSPQCLEIVTQDKPTSPFAVVLAPCQTTVKTQMFVYDEAS